MSGHVRRPDKSMTHHPTFWYPHRLRRRIDAFSTTTDTTACRFVATTWYRLFPRLALVLNYIPRPLCLSKVAPSVVLLCSDVTMVARLNWSESFGWAPALRSSRKSLEFRSSAPADCCIVRCPQRRRRRLRRGSLTCWIMKTCLRVTTNILHRVFHLWPTRNDV